jgi:transposase
VAYGRDRGETDVDAITMDSLQDFFESDFEEFGYIFDPEATRWMVKAQHREDRTVRDLSDVLESINKF